MFSFSEITSIMDSHLILKQKIAQREAFFDDTYLKSASDTKKISVIAVMHLLDTGIPFVNVLQKYFSLECIIPKRNSINKNLFPFYPQEKILSVTRDELKSIDSIKRVLERIPRENKLVLLDIGGYFSVIANDLKSLLGERFLGVIEDTENGHQKYLSQPNLLAPVISVARSPLKNNEDHLVGQAVVFSTDALLREQGVLINNKKVGVIGFGKIGNGILSSLRDKGCSISVYDTDPIVLISAYSKGNSITNKLKIIENSDIIFCSTGQLSLKGEEFKFLKNGVFIASVTSSDDEMDISWMEKNYTKKEVSEHISFYENNGHFVYLLNNGNAINFLHGAVVDDFILLVQKEMMDTILYMSASPLENKVQDGSVDIRSRIADSWLKYFLSISV